MKLKNLIEIVEFESNSKKSLSEKEVTILRNAIRVINKGAKCLKDIKCNCKYRKYFVRKVCPMFVM